MFDVMSDKPGNVSLGRGHHDMSFIDFLLSAAAIAPVMEQAPFQPIGQTILESIRATRRVTDTNTNLGIVLLLAPLASVPPNFDLKGGLIRALIRLTVEDAQNAYEAIRLAKPGGLGDVAEQDIAGEPTVSLREAMALAADRDIISRQYVNDFEQVFEGAEYLNQHLRDQSLSIETAAQRTFLQLLAKYPDSLIIRKFGREAAVAVSAKAREVVATDYDDWEIVVMDSWLRSGCSERLRHGLPKYGEFDAPPATAAPNPGTTADLVTASLFVALRRGIIQLPLARTQSEPPAG
jgi:triphosphoribosyl-dephospho-CoA synthase